MIGRLNMEIPRSRPDDIKLSLFRKMSYSWTSRALPKGV